MKVRQMKTNIDVEKILKIGQTNPQKNTQMNKWTREQMKERAKWMEQRFINEISSTTWEIEESWHDNWLFWQFLENIEDCYQQNLMWKSKEISQLLRPILKNGDFQHISGIFGREKIFLKNWNWPCQAKFQKGGQAGGQKGDFFAVFLGFIIIILI